MGTNASGRIWPAGAWVVAWALGAGFLLAGDVEAKEVVHARISFDGGGGLVKGISDEDWSYLTLNSLILEGDEIWVDEQGAIEVEMAGGTFLRMADVSNAEVVSLPPSAVIRAKEGAFYAQRLRFSSGQIVLETPLCQVIVERYSQVRVDVFKDGRTTVTVWQGSARIRMQYARDVLVMRGQRAYVDPGYLPSGPEPFDSGEEDDFDRWNRERSELVVAAAEAIPPGIGIKDEVIGAEDLGMYGDWVQVGSEYRWQPRVDEDFVPYRDGYWSYVPAVGYVWVGQYPFSYITMHYGRWRYDPESGWFWVYRSGWAPAWAATLRIGSSFIWCPLDARGCPVVTSTACFPVGGMHFGVYATTCCAVDQLLAGRCTVYACTPTLAQQFVNARAEIWRIFMSSRNQLHIAYSDPSMRVRDYTPRRVIRGPDLPGPGRQSAPARVAALETRPPDAPHSSETATLRSGVRAPVTSEWRPTRVRSVHMDAKSPADAPRSTSTAITQETPKTQVRPQTGSSRVIRIGVRREADSQPHAQPDAHSQVELGNEATERTSGDSSSETFSRPQRSEQSPAPAIRSVDAEETSPVPDEPSPTQKRDREITSPGAPGRGNGRTVEQAPSAVESCTESPVPLAEPRHADPPEPDYQRPAEIHTPTHEVVRQVPEPISESGRAIRSEPQSSPSTPSERHEASQTPPAASTERDSVPAAPAPTGTVETPPSATSPSVREGDSSRSVGSTRH